MLLPVNTIKISEQQSCSNINSINVPQRQEKTQNLRFCGNTDNALTSMNLSLPKFGGKMLASFENHSLEEILDSKNFIYKTAIDKTDIEDGSGLIEYSFLGRKEKLVYKNGKLDAASLGNTYYKYSDKGERLYSDSEDFNRRLNKALSEKYSKQIENYGSKIVDKSGSKTFTKLNKFEPTVVSDNAHISIANRFDVYLNEEPYTSMADGDVQLVTETVRGLKDRFKKKQQVTDVDCLLIKKDNGKYIVTSLVDASVELKTPKIKPTPLTEIEKKIKTVNKDITLLESTNFNKDDSIYSDIPRFSEYLHNRMFEQTGNLKPEEIERSAENLSKKYGISEQEVLNIMARIAQYGAYSQLEKLGEKLTAYNIGKFYNGSGISMNASMHYLSQKKAQFEIQGDKKAFIIDDASVTYLEKMSKSVRDEFLSKVDDGEIVLINLDGTGIQIGNNNYSYTIFDGGQNLEAMTEAVIQQINDGGNLDDTINKGYQDRLKSVLGEDALSKVKNIRINNSEKNTAEDIANQINQKIPSKNEIRAAFEIYSVIEENTPENIAKAGRLLARYSDKMLKVVSKEGLATLLNEKHKEISDYVKKLGKTEEDIVYICPNEEKSFALIGYMYAKANGIDYSKFKVSRGLGDTYNGKVAVILDDIFASADSVLKEKFFYNTFVKKNPDVTVLFAPTVCAKEGKNNINFAIKNNKRKHDKLLCNDKMISNFTDCQTELKFEDVKLLLKVLQDIGWGDCMALCTAFPYMVPDNCSSFSGFLLNPILNNFHGNKARIKVPVIERIQAKAKEYDEQDAKL